MTLQKALKEAQKRYGKAARVETRPRAARIGIHGEFVQSHFVFGRKNGPEWKMGRYLCNQCSDVREEDAGTDMVERKVWHKAGGFQASCVVGVVMMKMFFEVRAEAESFEKCFEIIDERHRKAKEAQELRELAKAGV